MGKEEDYIKANFGTKSPFKAPNGYFEQLTDKIMEELPQKEILVYKEESAWTKFKPLLYMAAMFIAILIPIRFMVTTPSDNLDKKLSASITTITSELSEDELIDLIEPSTIDNYTLYEYLSNAE